MQKLFLLISVAIIILGFEVTPTLAFIGGESLAEAIIAAFKDAVVYIWDFFMSMVVKIAEELKTAFMTYLESIQPKGQEFRDRVNGQLGGLLDGNVMGIMKTWMSSEDEELSLSEYSRPIDLEAEFEVIDEVVHNFEVLMWLSVGLICFQIAAAFILILVHFGLHRMYQDYQDRIKRLTAIIDHIKGRRRANV